ncbi:hypothetical protein LguiA_011689 [Lonicera macranthoides]
MMGMEDLHASQEEQQNGLVVDMLTNGGFYAIDEEKPAEIWLEGTDHNEKNITDMNNTNTNSSSSLFYNDFPPLPDFPCMSSSSSSSSTPAPSSKAPISSSASSSTSSSSSSALSWSVLRSDSEDAPPPPGALSGTSSMEAVPPSTTMVDCMDLMENFGYMDLIDVNDIWDPSSIFNCEDFQEEKISQQQQLEGQEQQLVVLAEEERQLDELGTMFFEWLKTNKEHISAQDMRSIKLKRSTVESASKRLGNSKEGKKQLLKLILEWVEQYQLQKKRNGEHIAHFQFRCQYLDPRQNPNPNTDPNITLTSNSVPTDPNTCFLALPPPYGADPAAAVLMAAAPAPPVFYPGDSYSNVPLDAANFNQTINCHHYPTPSVEYQMIDSAPSWPHPQFMMGPQYNQFPENIPTDSMNPQPLGFYPDQYPCQVFGENGERLLRLGSSATKEARKNRMARQRRISSHHHSRHHHSNHQNQQQNQGAVDRNVRLGGEHFGNTSQSNQSNWVYLPCGAAAAPPGVPTIRMMPAVTAAPPPHLTKRAAGQGQSYQRQATTDRRQGWKQEKNLKFLLQKVLKQSDVGNLGRIVLPKKEAETHLPGLETRDGISIAMEDIGTSRVWNMRYRNEMVQLIRGVKVRQPGPKPEGKKTARRNQRSSAQAGNGPSSSSTAKQNGE